MAAPKITEGEVENLLRTGQLSITGTHKWKIGDNKYWVRAEIPVATSARNVNLRICVSFNAEEQSRRTFALVLNHRFRIRALCVEGSHTNKHTDTARWVRATHKHRWSDVCQDRFAYTPTDITATEFQEQLEQFCAECGIAFTAELAPAPSPRKELYDDDL
jgi:hypothetical protein